MAIQSDGETFLQILFNGVGDQNGIYFGHTTQPISAGITFNFSGDRDLAFFTNASAPSLLLNNQGKLGIGTLSPIARLHVADSNVVFTGPATLPVSTTYDPPIQGTGTRMMWYPQKAAFRVGHVDGDRWNKSNIGDYSMALGYNNQAIGYSSIAMGNFTNASGFGSTAMGSSTNAGGSSSTAIGIFTSAIGNSSTAIGSSTTARSFSEIAIGSFNTDYAPLSYTEWNADDRLFIIGNGANGTKSDAMVILKKWQYGHWH